MPHNVACPSALIGASNFFELAVAAAIALFGFQSEIELQLLALASLGQPLQQTKTLAQLRDRLMLGYSVIDFNSRTARGLTLKPA